MVQQRKLVVMVQQRKLVVCAGGRRSGSTWLFNALKFILLFKGHDVYAHFFNRYYNPENNQPYHLLKIHKFEEKVLRPSDFVFTIHRDLRDVAASLVRRKLIKNDQREIIDELKKIMKRELKLWCENATLDLKYEDVIEDKPKYIQILAQTMEMPIELKDAAEIHKKVERLPIPEKRYSRITHLHPNHITDGTWGSYKKTLSKEAVKKIEEEFQEWLTTHGYL